MSPGFPSGGTMAKSTECSHCGNSTPADELKETGGLCYECEDEIENGGLEDFDDEELEDSDDDDDDEVPYDAYGSWQQYLDDGHDFSGQ